MAGEKKEILQIDDIPENALVSEVAEFFRVHKVTVREWVLAGKFPNAYKQGKAYRIPKEDVINLMHEMYGQR